MRRGTRYKGSALWVSLAFRHPSLTSSLPAVAVAVGGSSYIEVFPLEKREMLVEFEGAFDVVAAVAVTDVGFGVLRFGCHDHGTVSCACLCGCRHACANHDGHVHAIRAVCSRTSLFSSQGVWWRTASVFTLHWCWWVRRGNLV